MNATPMYGNCLQCGRAGALGAYCVGDCRVGGDLADINGQAVANDLHPGCNSRCRYVSVVMPDGHSIAAADKWQMMTRDDESLPSVPVGHEFPRQGLLGEVERNCAHHGNFVNLLEGFGVEVPPEWSVSQYDDDDDDKEQAPRTARITPSPAL